MAAPSTIDTAADLAAAVQQAVGGVVWRGPARSRFGVQGRTLGIGAESADVYTFADPAARATAQSEIGADGKTFQGQPLSGLNRPRIWGIGRLLVVYDGGAGETFVVLSGLLGDPIGVPAPLGEEPYPPAVAGAVAALAQSLGISPSDIQVVDFQTAIWPDGCLGLGGPGDACAVGEVSGWQVTLAVGGSHYEVRTDDLGQVARWAGR
jgi:hypothetical protein